MARGMAGSTALWHVAGGMARQRIVMGLPPNTRWSRWRLSALVVPRLLGFDGRLVQYRDCANPALRLTRAVRAARSPKSKGRPPIYHEWQVSCTIRRLLAGTTFLKSRRWRNFPRITPVSGKRVAHTAFSRRRYRGDCIGARFGLVRHFELKLTLKKSRRARVQVSPIRCE